MRLFPAAKPKITWTIPRWFFVPRLWGELNSVLNPTSLIRITIGSFVLSVAVVVGFKWAVPQMVLPNLWPILFALPGIVLTLILQFGLLTLIPPTAIVRKDRIVVQHGQNAIFIDAESVSATFLTFHADNRIRLRICYTRKSKPKSRVIGVSPTVNFDRLSEMLPIPPVVRDARNRARVPSPRLRGNESA